MVVALSEREGTCTWCPFFSQLLCSFEIGRAWKREVCRGRQKSPTPIQSGPAIARHLNTIPSNNMGGLVRRRRSQRCPFGAQQQCSCVRRRRAVAPSVVNAAGENGTSAERGDCSSAPFSTSRSYSPSADRTPHRINCANGHQVEQRWNQYNAHRHACEQRRYRWGHECRTGSRNPRAGRRERRRRLERFQHRER